MYTYTTPTITCRLRGADFTGLAFVRIAIRGNGPKIIREVPLADIDTEEGTTVIRLSQEETAALGSGKATIQARLRYNDGTVVPTTKVTKQVDEIIDKVVI